MAGIIGSFIVAKAQAYVKGKFENIDPVNSILAFAEVFKVYTLYLRFKQGSLRDAAPWLLVGSCLGLLKSKEKKFEVVDALTLHPTKRAHPNDYWLIVFPIAVLAVNFLIMKERRLRNFDPFMPIMAMAQGAAVVRLIVFRS